MATGIIGRKLGMTRVFAEDGTAVPVTVIEAGPCHVLHVRDSRAQLGWARQEARSRTTKADLGHAKAAGLDFAPQIIRSFPLNGAELTPGATVTVEIFAAGDLVKVTGTTKGRGFQGVVHRYGFHGGPATHGNTRHRKPGSIGPGTDPSRVIKGKKMPGSHGRRAAHRAGPDHREGRRRAESAVRARGDSGLEERHRDRREAGREEPP